MALAFNNPQGWYAIKQKMKQKQIDWFLCICLLVSLYLWFKFSPQSSPWQDRGENLNQSLYVCIYEKKLKVILIISVPCYSVWEDLSFIFMPLDSNLYFLHFQIWCNYTYFFSDIDEPWTNFIEYSTSLF